MDFQVLVLKKVNERKVRNIRWSYRRGALQAPPRAFQDFGHPPILVFH